MDTIPHYAPIDDWCAMSGMGRRSVYERLATGELRSVKVGRRTLIDVRAGLSWLSSLAPAEIKMPPRVVKPAKEAAGAGAS